MHLQDHHICLARTLSNFVLQRHCVPEAAAGTASVLSTFFLDSFCLTGFGLSETALPCWGCSWPALEPWTGSWTEAAACAAAAVSSCCCSRAFCMLDDRPDCFCKLGGRSDRLADFLGAAMVSAAFWATASMVGPLPLFMRDPRRRLADWAVALNSEVSPAKRPCDVTKEGHQGSSNRKHDCTNKQLCCTWQLRLL